MSTVTAEPKLVGKKRTLLASFKGEKRLMTFCTVIHRNFVEKYAGKARISKEAIKLLNQYVKNVIQTCIEEATRLRGISDSKTITMHTADCVMRLVFPMVQSHKDLDLDAVHFGVTSAKIGRYFRDQGFRIGEQAIRAFCGAVSDSLQRLVELSVGAAFDAKKVTVDEDSIGVAYHCAIKEGKIPLGGLSFESAIRNGAISAGAKQAEAESKKEGGPKPKRARKSKACKSRKGGKRRKAPAEDCCC